MNIILNEIKNILFGRRIFQPFFEFLYRISLYGMNIGNGGTVSTSGELNVIKIVRILSKKGQSTTIFDAGANKGEYAEAIVETFSGAPFSLFVFEPSKAAFSLLQENASLSSSKVTLVNKGVSDKNTTATLHSNTPGSKLGSVFARIVPGKEFTEKEEISLTTIDTFCEEKLINHINFLKLDIEGNELPAMHGANNLLTNGSIDAIQFEFGGANIDARTYLRDFWNLLSPHYKIFRVLKDGLREISGYDEKLELFSTTNYFALKRELSDKL